MRQQRDWMQKKHAHELARRVEQYYAKQATPYSALMKCFVVEQNPPTKAWIGGSKIYCVRSTRPVRYA